MRLTPRASFVLGCRRLHRQLRIVGTGALARSLGVAAVAPDAPRRSYGVRSRPCSGAACRHARPGWRSHRCHVARHQVHQRPQPPRHRGHRARTRVLESVRRIEYRYAASSNRCLPADSPGTAGPLGLGRRPPTTERCRPRGWRGRRDTPSDQLKDSKMPTTSIEPLPDRPSRHRRGAGGPGARGHRNRLRHGRGGGTRARRCLPDRPVGLPLRSAEPLRHTCFQ